MTMITFVLLLFSLLQIIFIVLSLLFSIGAGTLSFYSCSALTKVLLISGLTVIGADMFDMSPGFTSLASLTIPSTLTKIGEFIILNKIYYIYHSYVYILNT